MFNSAMEKKYTLYWQTFSEHLQLMFKDLYQEEMYSDVITRAKASLTLARYMDSEFYCSRCFGEDDIEQDTVVKNIGKFTFFL